MMRHVLLVLALPVLALSGCDTVISQLNAGRPFVVLRDNPSQGKVRKPNISTVLLLGNGNLLETGRLTETYDEIYPNAFAQEPGQSLHLSPDAKFIGLTQPDASNTENNVAIFRVPNGREDFNVSDNTLAGEMERVCNTPAILADIYGGPPDWGPNITNYRLEFEDDIANQIEAVGWTGSSQLVVNWIASLRILADETNPDGTISVLDTVEPADFYMVLARSAPGQWTGAACLPDPPTLAMPRQTTPIVPAPVSGVLVNGVAKDTIQPLGRVREVHGPY